MRSPRRSGIAETEPLHRGSRLELAPFGLRLMAAAVDVALIVGLVCADVAHCGDICSIRRAMKAAEIGCGHCDFIAAVALYHCVLSDAVARATPGMMYARISLCTFDDENPTREQLRDRLGAMLLSLLPVGLGVAWAIFDEDHLSWHDGFRGPICGRC